MSTAAVVTPAHAQTDSTARGLAVTAQTQVTQVKASLPRSVSAESFGALASSAATSTTTGAIQSALTATRNAGGGVVTLLTPGTYTLTNTLSIASDTELKLGSGVTLRLANGINAPILRNTNWNSPVVSVTGITAALDTFPPQRYIITVTAPNHNFNVGDYVLIKGDTSDQYVGVRKVTAVIDANTFQMYMGSRGTLTAATGTLTAAKADANITISGGALDFNGKSNGSGGLASMMTIFNKVGNLKIQDQLGMNSTKYAYYVGNGYGLSFNRIELNTNSDGIHLMGPVRDIAIDGVRGSTGDDMVAYTATNGGGYTAYDLPDNNGEIINLSVKNVNAKSAVNAVAIYPVQGYTARNLRIENVFAAKAVSVGVNVSSIGGNPAATLDDLYVDGITGMPGVSFFVAGYNGGGSVTADAGTINRLTLRNVRPTTYWFGAAGRFVNIASGWTVRSLGIKESSFLYDASVSGAQGVYADGNILKLSFDDITTDTTAFSSATTRLAYGPSIQEIAISNSTLGGNAFGGLWDTGAENFAPLIWARNLRLGNVSEGVYGLMISGHPYRLILDGMTSHGAFTFSNALINPQGSGKTYIIRLRNLTFAGNIFPTTYVGTVNFSGDETAPVDITKIARVDGASVYNSNATANNGTDGVVGTGLFTGVGTAVGSWKHLGTAGGTNNQY